jgi:Rrf2 family nitric oxide-sensitive transcriptional repressor
MKISAKLDYALRLLVKLAESPEKVIHTSEVSNEEKVSLKFLQSIVKELKDKDIIDTFFGPHGGIVLARPPEDIRFLEIYEIFQNDLRVVEPCVEFSDCGHLQACGIQKILHQGQIKMRDYFQTITLLDIKNKHWSLTPEQ